MCDLRKTLGIGLLLAVSVSVTHAGWVAFNDHYKGAASSNNATFWNVYTNLSGAPGNAGALKNITNGTALSVTLTITNQNLPQGISPTAAPTANTPAATAFTGWIDWGQGSNYWNDIVLNSNSVVAHVFTGLRTDRQYSLKATAIRGAGLTNSWVLCHLDGAAQFVNSHSANVQTYTKVPSLATNEAILKSGANNDTGDIFYWENILPANGTLVLYSYKYSGPVLIPGTTNFYTSSYSNSFALTAIRLEEKLATPVIITAQPRSANVCAGSPVSFSVGVSGSSTPPFHYQWRKAILGVSTNDLPGENSSLYSIPSAGAGDQASYQVVVTNSVSSVTSQLAALTVLATPVVVTNQPDDVLAAIGDPFLFSLDVTNNAAKPIYVRWYQNSVSNSLTGTAIPGATNIFSLGTTATYSNSYASPTNAPFYYAIASNCLSVTTSRVASLSIYFQALVITNQPDAMTIQEGQTATLTVGVDGSVPSYQWYKQGGGAILNQTNATFVLANAAFNDSGYYYVVVTNPVSSVVSTISPVNGLIVVNQKPYSVVNLFTTGSTGSSSNATWKYNQQGVDLGTSWVYPNYNDNAAGWSSGKGGLAHEDAATTAVMKWVNTSLNLVNNGATNWTYYFRTTFNLTNDPQTCVIHTTNIFDDGMVVYLNGTEVYRFNMPAGPITYSTPAASTISGPFGNEGDIFVTNIPSALLVRGTNTLAVEAHQVNLTSSDIVMCLGAAVTFNPPLPILITNQPPNTTAQEAQNAQITVGFQGYPAYVQWFKLVNNTAIMLPWGISPTLTLTNVVDGVDDGYYFATVSNILGQVTSSSAFLNIIPDTNAPMILHADGTGNPNTITLTFNEPLMAYYASRPQAAPTNASSYSVTNTLGNQILPVTSAVFTNGTNVILTTSSGRSDGVNYIVTLGTNGVVDISPRHNLATNLCAPVSSLQKLIQYTDWFDWDQPLSFSEVDYYYNTNANRYLWRSNSFNPYNYALYPGSSWGSNQGGFCNVYTNNAPFVANTGLSESDQYSAAYFRRVLSYNASPLGITNRQVRYYAQSGLVLYLNGREISRFNMPAGDTTPDTHASSQLTASTWSGWIPLPESYLVQGNNVVAAELHTTDPTDFFSAFAAEMMAQIDSLAVGPAIITTQPASLTVFEGQPAVFTIQGAGGLTFQWRTNSVNDPTGTNTYYIIPSAKLAQNGLKVSVLMTGSGSGNTYLSSNATMTVLADTNPPVLISAFLTASNIITAHFSEAITSASANNILNYAITNALGPNLNILSATLTNGSNVLIKFAAYNPGSLTLVATQIRDASIAGNFLATNSRVTVGLNNWVLSSFDGTTPQGAWRFNQSDVDLGTGWRLPSYSDGTAGWQGGTSVLDWDSVPPPPPRTSVAGLNVGTELMGLNSDGNALSTIYFRQKVNVPMLTPDATCSIRHLIDSGGIWYLNGTLAYYFNMNLPGSFLAYANSAVGTASIVGPEAFDISSLTVGTNLVAVEVHAGTPASQTITFGTELLLNVPSLMLAPGGPTNNNPAPTPVPLSITTYRGTNVVVSWSSNGAWTLQYKKTVGTNTTWVAVPSQTNPYTNAMGTNKTYFYRLNY